MSDRLETTLAPPSAGPPPPAPTPPNGAGPSPITPSWYRAGSPFTLLFEVGQANLHYMGSITLNEKYRRIGIKDGMLCQINNLTGRSEVVYTYVIYDSKISDSKVCLNGAAAHRFSVGDRVEVIPMFLMTLQEPYDKLLGTHVYYDTIRDEPR